VIVVVVARHVFVVIATVEALFDAKFAFRGHKIFTGTVFWHVSRLTFRFLPGWSIQAGHVKFKTHRFNSYSLMMKK
jgi:hypothetical protein